MSLHTASALAQTSDAGVFAGLGAMMILVWVIGGLLTIFWLWMLVDCLTGPMPTNEKILWAIVMLVVPFVGSLIYFFVKRGGRARA